MPQFISTLGNNGRTTIPNKIIKALNLNRGDKITFSLDGDIVTLSSPRSSLKRLQTLLAKCDKNLVDKLLEERRSEKL